MYQRRHFCGDGRASNVGFILSNQRTKETHYYPCAGADEYSAMSSAEGILQQMRYTATFRCCSISPASQPILWP